MCNKHWTHASSATTHIMFLRRMRGTKDIRGIKTRYYFDNYGFAQRLYMRRHHDALPLCYNFIYSYLLAHSFWRDVFLMCNQAQGIFRSSVLHAAWIWPFLSWMFLHCPTVWEVANTPVQIGISFPGFSHVSLYQLRSSKAFKVESLDGKRIALSGCRELPESHWFADCTGRLETDNGTRVTRGPLKPDLFL